MRLERKTPTYADKTTPNIGEPFWTADRLCAVVAPDGAYTYPPLAAMQNNGCVQQILKHTLAVSVGAN